MALSAIRHAAALGAAAVVVSGGIGVLATTAAPDASAAPVSLRVVQHNTDQQEARWNRLVTLAESGSWDAVTAQEVCSGWVDALKAKHPGWTVAYHGQQAKADCPGGGKGNVAIHPGAGSRYAEPFNVAGEGKTFGMACAVFSKGGHQLHACSTHFTVYDPNPREVRLRQAQRVKQVTGEWIGRGHAVVVGGDLNTTPALAALDPIYQNPAGTSSGGFNEAAQLERGTTQRTGPDTVAGRKIDYVFFSANHTPLSAGATVGYEEPDTGAHKILKVRTTIR